ncbi:unnamed protein product [Brassica rapa]|uniref:G protein gamma domain-containing protein n=1 Tax=Brassica campestris TaxID=3711 RepID=A0A3P5ZQU7_BRACM|nr:unnamed protein product [Brassica rapa]VDC76963.1 unnamed protein product [Brassica rapa]
MRMSSTVMRKDDGADGSRRRSSDEEVRRSRERRSGGLEGEEEELEQLEKMDNGISLLQRIKNKLLHHLLSSSLDVLRFLNNVDSKPDPLLPQTTGAVNSTWDQWFERPKEAKRCGCFIL